LNEGSILPHPDVTIFDGDLQQVKEQFDVSSREIVVNFLQFLTQSFDSLFKLDTDQHEHPLLINARKRLGMLIPAVALNDVDGKLMRADVRHVILRQESVQVLMRHVTTEQLYGAGKDIGIGAAKALFDHVIKARLLIPSSAEALVKLWSYWDKTGGWGRLDLVPADPIADSTQDGQWLISIENNFLETRDREETHRFCNFWSGYIHGFLDEALQDICTLLPTLERGDRDQILLPTYTRVASVEHLREVSSSSHDRFRVKFEEGRYSQAQEMLNESLSCLRAKEYKLSMVCSSQALQAALTAHGGDLAHVATEIEDISKEDRDLLRQIHQGVPNKPTRTEANAQKWFSAVNQLVQQLSRYDGG
jgi:hypothetical protein